jgi:putative endonuclease
MATSERLRGERQGRRAESLAALWLRAQLFSIVAMRFKTPVGEADALAAVNRQRIIRAAKWYLSRNPGHAGSTCAST